MGTLVAKPSPHFNAGRSFYNEGEGKQNKEIKGRVLKSFLHADPVHFNKDLETGQGMVWHVSSCFYC